MILEAVVGMLFLLVQFIISLFPNINVNLGDSSLTSKLISFGLTWFPPDLWVSILLNIVFWITVQGTWIVLEWVYKKVPGVN